MDKANLGRAPYYNKWINDWQGRHDVVLSKEAYAELHGALSSEPLLVSPADPPRSEAATRKDAEAAAPIPDVPPERIWIEFAEPWGIQSWASDPDWAAAEVSRGRKFRAFIDQSALIAVQRERDELVDAVLRERLAAFGRGYSSRDGAVNACRKRAEAAEAEVARLKGAVTDAVLEAARVAYEANVPDDYRYSSEALRAAIRSAFEAALSNQAGASK